MSTPRYLCQGLSLTIKLDSEQLIATLSDDINFTETGIWYSAELGNGSRVQRSYQLREAMVIAMRRLISKAVSDGLISDYPGEPGSSSSSTAPAGPVTFSSIDMDA